jgi:hypothetical protein
MLVMLSGLSRKLMVADQFPVRPSRNWLFGMCSIARWIASRPSSRSLAWQACRRFPVIFEQAVKPLAEAIAFQLLTTAAQSSVARIDGIALAISSFLSDSVSVSVSVSGGVSETFRFARCLATRSVDVSDLY